MGNEPSLGERRAAGGLGKQYLVAASFIMDALNALDLHSIRVADPQAGRVDDIQIVTQNRLDAFQVKWAEYGGTISLKYLTSGETPLFAQLAKGWKELTGDKRRIVVHLTTNRHPSSSTRARLPDMSEPPQPYHFAAFVEQAWKPAKKSGRIEFDGPWGAVWAEILETTGLESAEFLNFVSDCELDLSFRVDPYDPELNEIAKVLFDVAGDAERAVQLSKDDLLDRLGWLSRFKFRNRHKFPPPSVVYRPIATTVAQLVEALERLERGYIAVVGSPGAGKSTLLSETLPRLPFRVVRYYAYVPDSQGEAFARGESFNFLNDIYLALVRAGIRGGDGHAPKDRLALVDRFYRQIAELGDEYNERGLRTIILVDGLDHIDREQQPERSLLKDLPLPESIPDGVFFVLGSQTLELPGIPPTVLAQVQQPGRLIEMAQLEREDVYEIVNTVMSPAPDERTANELFALSSGHPLALLYLLNQMVFLPEEERDDFVGALKPFGGDIHCAYESHWGRFAPNRELVRALALVSRVRGPIPLEWLAGWAQDQLLESLQRFARPYFVEQPEGHWSFFHNSFRVFLQRKTSKPLPGRTRELREREWHGQLADLFRSAACPWRWETLHHLTLAGQCEEALELATWGWYHEQAYNLRPLRAILDDAHLGIEASAGLRDGTELARQVLIGTSFEQRNDNVDAAKVAEFLIDMGRDDVARQWYRDGNHLRIKAVDALRLARKLWDAGVPHESERLFRLSEPLDLLSGRPLDSPNNDRDRVRLLRRWMSNAAVIEPSDVVLTKVRRLDVVDEDLQMALLCDGFIACCETSDWDTADKYLQEVQKSGTSVFLYFALISAAEAADEVGDASRAKCFLAELKGHFSPDTVLAFGRIDERQAAYWRFLRISRRLLPQEDWIDWLKVMPVVPVFDDSPHEPGGHVASLLPMMYRRARLRYECLGETRSPESLVAEAFEKTRLPSYRRGGEQERLLRQLAYAWANLARVRSWAAIGVVLQPAAFLNEVRLIIDLICLPPPKDVTFLSIRWRRLQSQLLQALVAAASSHGDDVVGRLAEKLDCIWANRPETRWPAFLRRIAVLALYDAGIGENWCVQHLEGLDHEIPEDADPSERVEFYDEQADAWIHLGQQTKALDCLRRMVARAGGIRYHKDYQLTEWTNWLRMAGTECPSSRVEGWPKILQYIYTADKIGSGGLDAARELILDVVEHAPPVGVALHKRLLEDEVIGIHTALNAVLFGLLSNSTSDPNWLLPLVGRLLVAVTEPDEFRPVVGSLIGRIRKQDGDQAACDAGRYLAAVISTEAPTSIRAKFYTQLANALPPGWLPEVLGINRSQLEESDTSSSSVEEADGDADRLDPEEMLAQVQNMSDLISLYEKRSTDRPGDSSWGQLVTRLINSEKIAGFDLEQLYAFTKRFDKYERGRPTLALAERHLRLGNKQQAADLASVVLGETSAWAWSKYTDSGLRYDAIALLSEIDSDDAHQRALKLLIREVGNECSYESVALNLGDVLNALGLDYAPNEIWGVVEQYLDDIFQGLPLSSARWFESVLHDYLGEGETGGSSAAVTEMLFLYLQHPTYALFEASAQAIVESIRIGHESVHDRLVGEITEGARTARALAVGELLAAISNEQPKSLFDAVEDALSSPTLDERITASRILARRRPSQQASLPRKDRAPSLLNADLHLPSTPFATQRPSWMTGEGVAGAATYLDAPNWLTPFEVDLQLLAGMSGISFEILERKARSIFDHLPEGLPWRSKTARTGKALTRWLHNTGLNFGLPKPRVERVRRTLCYLIADLYDGGDLDVDDLRAFQNILLGIDLDSLVQPPTKRPGWLSIGIDPHDWFVRKEWLGDCEASLPNLCSRTPDGALVIAEWTDIYILRQDRPGETRMSMVRRGKDPGDGWSEARIRKGLPPFPYEQDLLMEQYLQASAEPDDLVVGNRYMGWDIAPAYWLGLNPLVGSLLRWTPARGPWFRWQDSDGREMARSIWWRDGRIDSHHTSRWTHVAEGWLVVLTRDGYYQLQDWAGSLNSYAVIQRTHGEFASGGSEVAMVDRGSVKSRRFA